jgi:hypothetical protein
MPDHNYATKVTLDKFRLRAEELPFEAHPYSAAKKALELAGDSEWTPDTRAAAIKQMAIWTRGITGQALATVMNEINAVINDAKEHDAHAAANNLNTSLPFVEDVFNSFLNDFDANYIAEQLFEDGLKIEQGELKKEPVKVFNHVHSRWQPSVN